jgi:hemerythrin-like domain-containing protein
MLITKNYRADQETIIRFLDVLGGGLAVLSGNKNARPGFFIVAHTFVQEFVEESFFKKEALLVKALEDNGFPLDDGPVGTMLAEQMKSHDAAEHMLSAAKGWQAGDEDARGEVGWAASEVTSTLRQHLDKLKSRVFPLLEQDLL